MSIDELYREVRKVNPRVGYATVYRTIKLLKECLADEQHFADGQTRYENVDVGEQHHHDHVICDRRGRIVEPRTTISSGCRRTSRPASSSCSPGTGWVVRNLS